MASSAPGVDRTCQNAEVVMPSLVSMPPNIITAAFETTSGVVSVVVASRRTPSRSWIAALTCRSSAPNAWLPSVVAVAAR